jgi:hypothetical protein
MSILFNRRNLLVGFGAVFAMPSIVRASSMMRLPSPPLGRIPGLRFLGPDYLLCNGALLPADLFPELYKSIGNAYGGTKDISFRLPDVAVGGERIDRAFYGVRALPRPWEGAGGLHHVHLRRRA